MFLIKLNHLLWLRLAFVAVLGMGFWYLGPNKLAKNPPLYTAMPKEYTQVASEQMAFELPGKDSSLKHPVYLLSDAQKQPLLYASDITTPVCIDGLCKPMYLTLYWSLVGDYVGYGVFQDNLLTKFDHEPFDTADYHKFHQLLLNKHSILERKTMEDLFDENIQAKKEKITFQGKEVDAVSGATKAEIAESVVKGALYSCFTAWHLAHGAVKERIAEHFLSIYSPTLANAFLQSNYEDYQFFALKQMDTTALVQNLPKVQGIFKSSSPMLRLYLMKKLPKSIWKTEAGAIPFFQTFTHTDINTRTSLLNHLQYAPEKASEILAKDLEKMSKNQLALFLKHLSERKSRLSKSVRTQLEATAKNTLFAERYLVEEFLKGL